MSTLNLKRIFVKKLSRHANAQLAGRPGRDHIPHHTYNKNNKIPGSSMFFYDSERLYRTNVCLGLIILRGSLVPGHVVRASFVSDTAQKCLDRESLGRRRKRKLSQKLRTTQCLSIEFITYGKRASTI